MPLSPNYGDTLKPNEMFEEHLAEIALDWLREPTQTNPVCGSSWSSATGLITVLAKSQAELIDLTGPSVEIASPAIDLTNEPVVIQRAA